MDRLLIVDDEESMRRLLRINLEDRYEIIDTGNSTQALALAMQEKPNAILLDLGMPKYSGFELCRTFNAMASTQLIPLIIVSGETSPTIKSVCRQLGAKAYFEKPVDYEALRAGLADVLQGVRPERRGELRVRLRVLLKLRGSDINKAPFEESSATENVSHSGFLCGCTAPLKTDAIVEVSLVGGGTTGVGNARVVWSEESETPYPRHGFRFVQKEGEWILQ
jgi:twitching motility two-component system response regulator PilH